MVTISYASAMNLSTYILAYAAVQICTKHKHSRLDGQNTTKMLSSPAPALPVLKHGGSENIDEQGVWRTLNA